MSATTGRAPAGSRRPGPTGPADREPVEPVEPSGPVLDGVMAGARVVSGIIAASLAEVEDTVTLPHLRVLVMASDRGALTLGDVADILSVHPSNATRQVERLVQAGLLDRRDDPANRRQLQLTLTPDGRHLVDTVLEHRREAFRRLLATLPQRTQVAVGKAMSGFAEAAGGRIDAQTWMVPTSTQTP